MGGGDSLPVRSAQLRGVAVLGPIRMRGVVRGGGYRIGGDSLGGRTCGRIRVFMGIRAIAPSGIRLTGGFLSYFK